MDSDVDVVKLLSASGDLGEGDAVEDRVDAPVREVVAVVIRSLVALRTLSKFDRAPILFAFAKRRGACRAGHFHQA